MSTGSAWGSRRDSVRHTVSAPATLVTWNGNRVACDIADLSRTGAALRVLPDAAAAHWHGLEPATQARLEFEVADAGAASAPATITRRSRHEVGVRFTAPDDALVDALRALATAAVDERVAEFERTSGRMPPERRECLHACRKALSDFLPNAIWMMRTELLKGLRDLARSGTGRTAHAAQAEAARVEARAVPITREIEVTMVQRFAEMADLDQTQELTMMLVRAANTGTALGEAADPEQPEVRRSTEEHVAALCRDAGRRFHGASGRLERRIAGVVGHPIDPAHNPLLPEAICRIFWRAVVDQIESPRVEKIMIDVLRNEIVPLIGTLYERLTDVLDAHPDALAPDASRPGWPGDPAEGSDA